MKLAKSLDRLGTETAFSVLAEAKKLEATGKPMIHLGLGQPDVKTPTGAMEKAAMITMRPAGADEAANLSDKGNKANKNTEDEIKIIGPIVKRNLSAVAGTINSLVMALIPSAIFCRIRIPE